MSGFILIMPNGDGPIPSPLPSTGLRTRGAALYRGSQSVIVQAPALYAAYFECSGVDLFKAACEHDLEGIVAKLATGRYEPKATTWVKIKNRTSSQAEGRADFFDIGVARESR